MRFNRRPLLQPVLLAPWRAPKAPASVWLDVPIEVLLAVVVREFLARLDPALGHDEHSALANLDNAVWAT